MGITGSALISLRRQGLCGGLSFLVFGELESEQGAGAPDSTSVRDKALLAEPRYPVNNTTVFREL